MSRIQVLDQVTIDKIAAGEVIERPASIVKELLENAIDAGATSITVEIRDGGISFIRVTDNGCGIEMEDIPAAFLRHSTSKITYRGGSGPHLLPGVPGGGSLQHRGRGSGGADHKDRGQYLRRPPTGSREEREDIRRRSGAPDGTTFLVRQLFYNTPARRKFLKTPMTEASHVARSGAAGWPCPIRRFPSSSATTASLSCTPPGTAACGM